VYILKAQRSIASCTFAIDAHVVFCDLILIVFWGRHSKFEVTKVIKLPYTQNYCKLRLNNKTILYIHNTYVSIFIVIVFCAPIRM